MNFIFEGFGATYNVFFLIALLIFTLGASYWTYRNVEGLSSLIRSILISLRASVFLILILLLLNPAFTVEQENRVKTEIAVLLDNSQSVLIEKGEYEGEASYQQVLQNLGLRDTTDVKYTTWAFNGITRIKALDSLKYDGTETDIHQALTTFREQKTNEQAVILISDGIYNKGRDPSYIAGRYPLPVFTLAVGDTSRLDDIVVQSVTSNRRGYKNTVTPVVATILNDGFPHTDISVQLRREGRIIDEQIFRNEQIRSVFEAHFELELDEAGLQQYEIYVPETEGEWTTLNNRQLFNIEVLDDKLRIMHLAFEIHPDVRSLRSVLSEDESIELDYRTWISGHRFVEDPFPDNPDTVDLIILQGFPSAKMPSSLIQEVRDYTQSKSVVFLSGPAVDYNMLSTLYGDHLPVRINSNSEKRSIHFFVNPEHQDNPVLELPIANLNRAPPLYAPVQEISAVSGSNVLLKADYRGNQLDIPVLTTRTIGNVRSALLSVHGFYRWYLSTDDQIRDYIVELINNTIKWAASSPDSRLLEITPSRIIFEESENVVLDAFLRNEAGREEDDALIEVLIDGDELSAERFYTMSNQGRGFYRLRIGSLPEGTYHFKATAKKGNHQIDERAGEFSVGNTNLEYINTMRNDALLNHIAEESGGAFYTFQETAELRNKLLQEGYFNPQSLITSKEIRAYQNPFWFIMVILLLTAEWGIRKVVALP